MAQTLKSKLIQKVRYFAAVSDDGHAERTMNLKDGDSLLISASRGPRGGISHTVSRESGWYTDERPTGGLADQIRDARRDIGGF